MASAALITFRIHRFEVLGAVLVMAVLGIALAVVPGRLEGVGVPDACFEREGIPSCRSLLDTFYAIRANEASWLMGIGAGLFPVAIGLILGVPIVARELEVGSASLAWSMSGDRVRWLLQRLLPILLLALTGLFILGVLEANLLSAVENDDLSSPAFDQLGSQGPTFLARGVMGMGIALLIGALIGRTLPAFAVSGLIALALVIAGAPLLYSTLAGPWSEWRHEAGDDGGGMLLTQREEWRVRDGGVFDQEEMEAVYTERANPDQWVARNITYWQYGLPYDRFGDLEAAETVVAGGIGVAAMLLTFPVVRRRRPV